VLTDWYLFVYSLILGECDTRFMQYVVQDEIATLSAVARPPAAGRQ